MSSYLIGLDLGQVQDYTALAIAERVTEEKGGVNYHVKHLERFRISYTAVRDQAKELVAKEPLRGNSHLIVDATGCGVPVVDMLRQEVPCPVVSITITGGDSVNRPSPDAYKVPKRDLVSALAILLGVKRLKFAHGLPLVETLVDELLNFRVRIDAATAHDSYGVWRTGKHDDLVLSLALACWYGEYGVWPSIRLFNFEKEEPSSVRSTDELLRTFRRS